MTLIIILDARADGIDPQSFYDYSIKPFGQQTYPASKPSTAVSGDIEAGLPSTQLPWEGRAIATHKFRLLEFSAFMEIRRDEIVSRNLKNSIINKLLRQIFQHLTFYL